MFVKSGDCIEKKRLEAKGNHTHIYLPYRSDSLAKKELALEVGSIHG